MLNKLPPDDQARAIGAMLWMVRDTLTAAQSQIMRAMNAAEQTAAFQPLYQLDRAVANLIAGPEFAAVQRTAFPPSLLAIGKMTDESE